MVRRGKSHVSRGNALATLSLHILRNPRRPSSLLIVSSVLQTCLYAAFFGIQDFCANTWAAPISLACRARSCPVCSCPDAECNNRCCSIVIRTAPDCSSTSTAGSCSSACHAVSTTWHARSDGRHCGLGRCRVYDWPRYIEHALRRQFCEESGARRDAVGTTGCCRSC
jgi:hypothetical protein